MHLMVASARVNPVSAERLIDGLPVVVYERPHRLEKRMRRRGLQQQHILAAARQSGMHGMRQVRYVNVERDAKVAG